jgi:hypothetical protein
MNTVIIPHQDLRKAVAGILHLRVSALRIFSVEEGCVIVTFLIPCQVADFLFSGDSVFTSEDVTEFQSLSVLWVKCNGRVYEFKNLQIPTRDSSKNTKEHQAITTTAIPGMLSVQSQ